MTYDEQALQVYGDMVTERHKVWRLRQAGAAQPWTDDPVLKNMKMTNMFRVLDPGSQYVFNFDSPNPIDVISRLVFYRITNLPSTWNMLQNRLGNFPTADDFIHKNALLFHILDSHRKAGNRVFSGAYIIIPEPGTANDKVGGALRLTRTFVTDKAEAFLNATTQAERFAVLRSTPGLGKFLAMQILTDWGYLQPDEPDPSFVVAGPGARRGTAILDPSARAEDVIHDLVERWELHPDVQLDGRTLAPMDVQNTMCEWSKYAREIATPRKKSTYRPAHPGIQAPPVLPTWWRTPPTTVA